ncbi:transglycosylase SLT domain-containing protein [Amycolatopsis sp. PS_44_ISF1]|uniref:transglycosylase SLT domain-containing protein n=1 Tax=Amycolatopsis sp. PS_44_ISF1 TaxID=2974917 RepID=UPI0028DE7BB3|nr:transglycosylase SLT domain-containing protein [Amycolatopsis sp. PS_44_ISF1]MDT8915246.1 transglycosylase SLT domain-containing protein [Amycolatopsis sp. PS_44_ISF1]
MEPRRGARARLAAWALVPVLAGCGASPGGSAEKPEPSSSAAAGSSPGPIGSPAVNPDLSRYAAQVRARAGEAGVDPLLVMAILDNESYKPHDPELERAWQKLKPDAAFGVANMHRATFDQTKRGRSFSGRRWEQLPDDPDLAIQAESWYLHDLAAQLPPSHGSYRAGELLALGYNTGPGTMKAFAKGAKPGPQAQSYLDRFRADQAKAAAALGP